MLHKKLFTFVVLFGASPMVSHLTGMESTNSCQEPISDSPDEELPATQTYSDEEFELMTNNNDNGITCNFFNLLGYDVRTESDNANRYVVCSCDGRRPRMEDAHFAVPATKSPLFDGLFGIFDGHGGEKVSWYLREELYKNLLDQCTIPLNKEDATKLLAQSFKDIFLETNEAIFKCPDFASQGSTALIAGIKRGETRDTLSIANVGDSRAVLCSIGADGQAIATPLSIDHKPSNPQELARIEATTYLDENGTVIKGTVRLTQLPNGTIIGRVCGRLAVSRAFGDKTSVPSDFITPIPDVTTIELQDDDKFCDKFLILACDGLWDALSNEEACKIVIENQANLTHAGCCLVKAALERESGDNITVIIIALSENSGPKNVR